MKKLFLVFMAAILTACGGDSNTISPPPPRILTIYQYDPLFNKLDTIPKDGNWGGIARYQGTTVGLVQENINWFSSSIDTRRIPFRPIAGGGPHNIISFDRRDSPLPIENGLRLKWDQCVDVNEGTGVSQLSLAFYFKSIHGDLFALVINTYDNRPEYIGYAPGASHDGNTDFVTLPIGNESYMTANIKQSNNLGCNSVNVTITREQFNKMFQLLPNRKINIDNYGLIVAGILHEGFTLNNPNIWVNSRVKFSIPVIQKL